MKALIVIDGQKLSDEEMSYIAKESLDLIQKIAPNSYLFDLNQTAHVLARLQEHVGRITNSYHIFYFKDEVDVFKYPVGR